MGEGLGRTKKCAAGVTQRKKLQVTRQCVIWVFVEKLRRFPFVYLPTWTGAKAREIEVMHLGEMNKLQIVRTAAHGVFLNGGEAGELFLSTADVAASLAVDDWVEVFVYLDTDDQLAVTTRTPLGQVGRFSYLKVAAVNQVGAFLNWGLKKDVLAPFNEQKFPMVEGASYMVYICLDDRTGRIIASSKIDRFLKSLNEDFENGQQVDLLIESVTDLGYKCIVNHSHWGILYRNEIFQPLVIGQAIKGYIKTIREDLKIDLCLQPPGYERVDAVTDKILDRLKENGGFLAVTDKSAPADIYALFAASKQAFKKAVGALYKQRRIALEESGIRLLDPPKAVEKKAAKKKENRSRR